MCVCLRDAHRRGTRQALACHPAEIQVTVRILAPLISLLEQVMLTSRHLDSNSRGLREGRLGPSFSWRPGHLFCFIFWGGRELGEQQPPPSSGGGLSFERHFEELLSFPEGLLWGSGEGTSVFLIPRPRYTCPPHPLPTAHVCQVSG